MYYVYVLKSQKVEGAVYVGSTADLKARFERHNAGDGAAHSKKFRPWAIEAYFAFTDKSTAVDFETYLKTGSGRAFMRKRLLSNQFKEALAKFNNGRNKSDEALKA